MTYNADKTWNDVSFLAGNIASSIIGILMNGNNAYLEWQSFRAGRTNAQIATDLSRTETEIAELDSCFSAFLALHNYANNQTPFQSDYYYSMRKFS